MERNKIIGLIQGYAAGTLTSEEETAFLQWYSGVGLEEFHEMLSQCGDLVNRRDWYPQMPVGLGLRLDEDTREIEADIRGLEADIRQIEAHARKIETAGQPERIPSVFFRRRQVWAAAILLVVCTGGYLFYQKRDHKDLAAHTQPAAGDIGPGSTKAILTLANGKKITLDSAGTSLLAQQGRTTIMSNNGVITYKKIADADEAGEAAGNPDAAPALQYNTISTGRGAQSPSLVLPDGTRVWLDAESSVRFPVAFIGNTREVEITGEAYLEVAKDATRPFRVKARNMEVQVLGTQFNINAYPDEPDMATTVLDGSVRVVTAEGDAGKTRQLVLLPGEQALAGSVGQQENIRLVKEADVDKVMAWKNGLFNFDHANLPTVLRQLARWYDIDIKFQGAVPERFFHGKITKDLHLSQVIQLLQEVEVKFHLEGKTLIVTK